MTLRNLLLTGAVATLLLPSISAVAQNSKDISLTPSSIKKIYFSGTLDGSILSTALIKSPNSKQSMGTIRYSYFVNTGINMHYNFSKALGFFTGVNIKNIGFIEQIKAVDSTVKRRVYTIGVPLGLKFGNLNTKNYGFVGGGVDFPFNYREKGFVKRNNKEKFSEWFSDRVPAIMPYVFAGFSVAPGFALKVQYYPSNFLNTSFTESVRNSNNVLVQQKPYAGYDVQLLMVSFGVDINSKKGKSNKVKKNKKTGSNII